jgi:hypothetical protein
VNTGAPLSSGYFTTSAQPHGWATTRCAHGAPDAVEIARPVRREAARRPPAERPAQAPRRRPYPGLRCAESRGFLSTQKPRPPPPPARRSLPALRVRRRPPWSAGLPSCTWKGAARTATRFPAPCVREQQAGTGRCRSCGYFAQRGARPQATRASTGWSNCSTRTMSSTASTLATGSSATSRPTRPACIAASTLVCAERGELIAFNELAWSTQSTGSLTGSASQPPITKPPPRQRRGLPVEDA